MKMLLRATSCLAIFLFAVYAASGQATRTWVSGVGDDANPCSRTAPCLTVAGAISKTAAGGEIDILDPVSFGTVTITKAITIDGGGGVVAGSLASGVNDIVVNAGTADVVTLRNLSLNGVNQTSSAGTNGVTILQAAAVHIEHCAIANFSQNGVLANANSALELYVDDSSLRNNTVAGVSVGGGSSTVLASIANTVLTNNGTGLLVAGNSKVTVQSVVATSNTGAGFQATANSGSISLNVLNSVSANNTGAGFQASGSGSSAAVVRLSNDSVYSNGSGLSAGTNGSIYSFGDNSITGVGAPTSTLAKQ